MSFPWNLLMLNAPLIVSGRALTSGEHQTAMTARLETNASAAVNDVPVEPPPNSHSPATLSSPALMSSTVDGQRPHACELKCLIETQMVDRLVAHVAAELQVDPFSARACHGYYQITTLATDTSDWRVFRRETSAARKYRIRRYGDESIVYLERKTRRGVQVRKQRVAVQLGELASLERGELPVESLPEPMRWFAAEVRKRELRPVCVLTCERLALVGHAAAGTMRLTFDRHLRVSATDGSRLWLPRVGDPLQSVTDGLVVCEFKFCGALPQVFKSAIERFALSPGGFSKFRHGLSRLKGWSITATQSDSGPSKSQAVIPESNIAAGAGHHA
jgi:hypothetical protein